LAENAAGARLFVAIGPARVSVWGMEKPGGRVYFEFLAFQGWGSGL
jgi:hypothetical protein